MATEKATKRIRLSEAQLSALECRPEGDFEIDGRYLVLRPGTADALCEASNAEDANAEYIETDKVMRTYARRAARSLGVLYGKAFDIEVGSHHQHRTTGR